MRALSQCNPKAPSIALIAFIAMKFHADSQVKLQYAETKKWNIQIITSE